VSGGLTGLTTSGGPITGSGTITLAGTLGVGYGGTSATTAPGANAALQTFTTTATASATTTLTNTSTYYQYFTGTLTQTITMPVTSTLSLGWSFHIANNSTGNLLVQSSGSNSIGTIIPGTTFHITCVGTALTTAADWDYGTTDFGTLTGTGDNVLATSPTLITPALGTPSSGTVTNLTGTASININGTVGATTPTTGAFTTIAANTTATITSANASALAVGRLGATTPVLQIDASTTTQAAGLAIKGAASLGGVTLTAIGGTNEPISVTSKGTGTAGFTSAGTGIATFGSIGAGAANIVSTNVTRLAVSATGAAAFTRTANATGVIKGFAVTGAADTNLTLSTEVNAVQYDLSQTRQWATGALTTQREFLINAPTYGFVGASTVTNAATFSVTGAPIGGTNATLTNSHGIYVPTSVLANTTNGFGATFNAPSGATNNYAAQFIGAIKYGGVALSNGVTGTGNMVLDTSPTLSGTITIPGSGSITSGGNLALGTGTKLSIAGLDMVKLAGATGADTTVLMALASALTGTGQRSGIAIGYQAALTTSEYGIAIGTAPSVGANQSVAIGYQATVNAGAGSSVAIGQTATAGDATNGGGAVAIGLSASCIGNNGLAIGRSASASASYTVAVGGLNQLISAVATAASGIGSTAIGAGAVTSGYQASAFGSGAAAAYNYSTTIGYNAAAGAANEIALGTSAETVKVYGTLTVAGNSSSTNTGTKTNILTTTTTNGTAYFSAANSTDTTQAILVTQGTTGSTSGTFPAGMSGVFTYGGAGAGFGSRDALPAIIFASSNEVARFLSGGGMTLAAGTLTVAGPIKLKSYTVATLPTPTTGMVVYVTDALAPTYSATLVGGGAVNIKAFYNGTNWVAG